MEVIYSIGSKFADAGIGNIAYHAVRGIYSHGNLKKIFCLDYRDTEIPTDYVTSFPLVKYASLSLRGFRKYIYNSFNPYWYIDRLYDTFASKKVENCDIFHGWNNHSLRSLRRAKELGAVTIIDRASSHPIIQDKLINEEYEKFNIKRNKNPSLDRSCKELEECDYIIIPSEFVEESFLEMGFPKEKLIKIPFGVNTERFHPNPKTKNNKFTVLFVGQVTPRKGVQYLLKAWEELNLKDAELRVCGPISTELKSIVDFYKNKVSIEFTGPVSNIEEEFKNADVFCFPSIEEGSALVTYEAMASGLPVIITYNTGSIARHDKDGFIIPIRNVEAIENNIQYFYDNPTEVDRMSKNARKHVESYSWEKYGEELVKAYNKIIIKR